MKVDEMREAFFEFDIDGDGTITTKVSTLQHVYWSTSIVWRSLTTTGAWDGDDAAWTFADRGGAEKDGCGGVLSTWCDWYDLIFIHIPI